MKHILTLVFTICMATFSLAQDSTDYYYEIPDYPESYSVGNVVARLVDGLGFRYYWATANFREQDLKYRPSEEARSSEETLDHIYTLVKIITNSTNRLPTDFTSDQSEMTFDQKRVKTLELIKEASENLKGSSEADLKEYKIVFIGRNENTEYPFWNQLNGPIADALWHVGQVVLLRRSSGNPFTSEVSVLQGRRRN